VKGFKVLARDQLSSLSLTSIPFVNTDDSNQPGSHWIAFFFYRVNDTVLFDYFDSYQNPLAKYGITLPYSHGESLSKPVQSNKSAVCGLWCVAFLYYRSRQVRLSRLEKKET
jgi:hypothetical protein